MSLHTIKPEITEYPFTALQKSGMAYIVSLGYLFEFRRSDNTFSFKSSTYPEEEGSPIESETIVRYGENHPNEKFDKNMVTIVP